MYLSIGSFCAFILLWAFVVEPRCLHIRRRKIHLHKPLSRPLTVLHLSDLHFPIRKQTLRRFFKKIADLEADMIVITGDLIENEAGIAECGEVLRTLRAKHGKFAIFGNHDHYRHGIKQILNFIFTGKAEGQSNDLAALEKALRAADIQLLRNQHHYLEIESEKFYVIGLDDPVTKNADPDKAFLGVNGHGTKILLTHSLDILAHMENREVHLALSGHTHGGQMTIPFYGAPPLTRHCRLGQRYMSGLNHYGEVRTHTSRGLGQGGFLAFRFLCPPEAILLEIQ